MLSALELGGESGEQVVNTLRGTRELPSSSKFPPLRPLFGATDESDEAANFVDDSPQYEPKSKRQPSNVGEPKRHHYINEAFQRNFSPDGQNIWVYDRKMKESRPQRIRDTAVMSHFYSVPQFDGTRDTTIEKALAAAEGHAARVIRSLHSREQVTSEEYGQLALFIALLHLRTPTFKDHVDEFHKAAVRQIVDLRGPAWVEQGEMDADILDMIQDERVTMDIARWKSLEHMIGLLPDCTRAFSLFDWEFLHTPTHRRSFITSDTPVLLTRPPGLSDGAGIGLATKGSIKLVPLSGSVCLKMDAPGTLRAHRTATQSEVTEINLGVARGATRFVLGRSQKLVEKIARDAKLATTSPPARAKFTDIDLGDCRILFGQANPPP